MSEFFVWLASATHNYTALYHSLRHRADSHYRRVQEAARVLEAGNVRADFALPEKHARCSARYR